LEHGEYIGDAVKREVLEETGLHVEVGALLGVFEVLGDQHYVILDHLVTADEGQEPRPGSDAAAVRWVHFGELAHIECTPRLVEMLMAWGVVPAN
jgi:8-oxo-dGTP diphosphatase